MAVAQLLRRTAANHTVSAPSPRASQSEPVHRVGKYVADYSELSPEEIAAPIPEMDALLARSKVISVKRGL